VLAVKLFSFNPDTGKLSDSGEEYEVEYVSLVNSETFGPPPLVAPSNERQAPRASVGERVLYINTDLVPAFLIERDSD
jgi:hypothetical protein